MWDPIFEMDYDTTTVHFEVAPASFGKRCRNLPEWKKMWIYASWKTPDAEYFIVNGWLNDRTLDPYTDGIVIELQGTECIIDQPGGIFSGKVYPYMNKWKHVEASPDVVRGLVSDMLHRYTVAFGGKKAFIKAVYSKSGIPPSGQFDAIRIPFEQYAKSP
jgi:hypothetical protein